MSTDNENEKIRSELEESEHSPKSQKPGKPDAVTVQKSISKWQPPLLGPLPETFLRIPQQLDTSDGDSSGAQDNSMLEDERIAMFLQNEEFMAELRWNEDFLNTLENGKSLFRFLSKFLNFKKTKSNFRLKSATWEGLCSLRCPGHP